MNFNTDGYLDAGLHTTTPADIKNDFVDTFTPPTTRTSIFSGYQQLVADLATFGVEIDQLIGGSFVSKKQDPSDIDLISIGDNAALNSLSVTEIARLRPMIAGQHSKPTYKCDSYFLVSFPETDPAYDAYRKQRKYWMGEFGYDRTDKPKGILTVNIKPNPPATPSASSGPAPTAGTSPVAP